MVFVTAYSIIKPSHPIIIFMTYCKVNGKTVNFQIYFQEEIPLILMISGTSWSG